MSFDILGTTAETNAEAWFNIALRGRKPEGSFGRTAQDGHLDSHWHSSCFYGRTRGEELKNETAAGSVEEAGPFRECKVELRRSERGHGRWRKWGCRNPVLGVSGSWAHSEHRFQSSTFRLPWLRATAHPRRGQRPQILRLLRSGHTPSKDWRMSS